MTTVHLENNRSMQAHIRLDSTSQQTLLLLHGLGDSSRAWDAIFEDRRFDRWNLVAPDLAGFGGTGASAGNGYRFADQLRRVGELLSALEPKDLLIVGHSMSGVMGGWLSAALLQITDRQDTTALTRWTGCSAEEMLPAQELKGINLRGFVSVEGTIAPEDASISHRAVVVAERGRFDRWYEAFVDLSSSDTWLEENPGADHYKHSIRQAMPEAFLACSRDLDAWKAPSDHAALTRGAHLFRSIDLPRAYYYGTRSVHPDALVVLQDCDAELIGFEGAGHWLMNEKSDQFRGALVEKLK